jgi:predicted ABC-type ATPase
LSSEKLRPRVEAAQAAGFMVILVFVTVRTAELNVGRVAQRVRLGGHPVPVDRIVRRRQASHGNFLWFALQSDIVLVFDNTDKPTLAYGRMRDTNWLVFKELCGAMHFLPDDMRIEITRLRGIDR